MMDYETQAVSRLTGQFQDSPKIKAMLAAIVSGFSKIESTLDQMKTERWVDSAIGAQLDGAGYIVGETRQGRDDDAYREAIRFRIFINISKGTPTDVIKGLKYITKPSDTQYFEQYPATIILFTNGAAVNHTINDVMQDISPAAISDVSVAVSYLSTPFRFARSPIPAELFVNGNQDYLEVDGSDLQVTTETNQTRITGATFGGICPAELSVNGEWLELSDGSYLAVHSPNHQVTIGQYNLTGVFQ